MYKGKRIGAAFGEVAFPFTRIRTRAHTQLSVLYTNSCVCVCLRTYRVTIRYFINYYM